MVISFKYKSTLFSHTRHRKHARKHSVEVHPHVLDAHRRRKSLPRVRRPPHPHPPPLPPIRHMVWSMFGSGELLATIMEKQNPTRSWQLEYSMVLNLFSRLSLTALALWTRKHWRYEIHGWLPVGMKCWRSGLLAWAGFKYVQRWASLPDQQQKHRFVAGPNQKGS